jgi:hypothetical protein
MTLEYQTEHDPGRWETAIKNVAEILQLDPDTVGNYLVIAYDGGPILKADTDLAEYDLIAMVTVFLEHVSGKTVRLFNEDGSPYVGGKEDVS